MRTLSQWLCLVTSALAVMAGGCGGGNNGGSPDMDTSSSLTFMSRKLYGGADNELQSAFGAMTRDDFAAGIQGFHDAMIKRTFVSRAELVADEIHEIKPDFIGLQEALILRTQTPPDGSQTQATMVEQDYTKILLAALMARGESYEVAATREGVDVEFPGTKSDLRYTETNVILARTDLSARNVKYSNPSGGDFKTTCVLPSLGGMIRIKRGWASVDVNAAGKVFTLIDSHLDFTCVPFDVKVQTGEGDELIAAAKSHDATVVIADLNSNADTSGVSTNPLTNTATYVNFKNAGLSDAWTGSGGFNCCFPDDLGNPKATLDQRIDFVFHRGGGFAPIGAGLTGTTKQTKEGYWASNHAGLWAKLKL